MSMTTAFYDGLIDFILPGKEPAKPLIIGINGVDGSGKTVLAGRLAERFEQRGYPACRISIDDFHHPRKHRYRRGEQSPEAYYHDSFNYAAFARHALEPVFHATAFPVRCQTKAFDLSTDKEESVFRDIHAETFILAEGVFLFRPELSPFLHLKIFIDADFGVIMDRVRTRDAKTLGSAEKIRERYEQKYIPGQKLYFEDIRPQEQADAIIDNNDFRRPLIKYP